MAPTVDAGADQDAAEGSVVTLDATVTDLDTEDTLTYAWSHNSTLSITFTGDIEDPSFTAPNVSEDTPVEFTLGCLTARTQYPTRSQSRYGTAPMPRRQSTPEPTRMQRRVLS